MKFCIVGCGMVGSTIAYSLFNVAPSRIHLVDIVPDRLRAEALDLMTASDVGGYGTKITFSEKVNEKFDAYIISAGRTMRPDEERNHLFEENKAVVEGICKDIMVYDNDPMIIMVTNPSHELGKVVLEHFRKVFVSGRSIDEARTKVIGKHEKAETCNYYQHIKNGKTYTNWGVATEVVKLVKSLAYV